jgi:hypothetical protein
MLSPVARVNDSATYNLFGRKQVGLHCGAVIEGDARAAVEARVPFEPIERGERRLVDLIHLARDRVLATADEAGKRPEVTQLETWLRLRLDHELRAHEKPMVRLASEECPVDEDARGPAALALGRAHRSTPAAVASGATSKPRRAYARHSTRK